MGSTRKKVGKTRKKSTDASNKEKKTEGEEQRLKVNWSRIIVLGFITSIIFVVINIIIAIIVIYGFHFDPVLAIQDILQYVFFGEVGFVVFLGACVGNFGQSIALTNLKARLFKSAPMSKDSFREATFNSFTYYSSAVLLLIYLMGMVQIL
ncbi:MAG: hypothetical protein ACTSUP_04995, partial [Candidatus Heimdallarchaeaceae archaeon]